MFRQSLTPTIAAIRPSMPRVLAVLLLLGLSIFGLSTQSALAQQGSIYLTTRSVVGQQVHVQSGRCLDSDYQGRVYFTPCWYNSDYQNWSYEWTGEREWTGGRDNFLRSKYILRNRKTNRCLAAINVESQGIVRTEKCDVEHDDYVSINWFLSGDQIQNYASNQCLDGYDERIYTLGCNEGDYQKWKNKGKWPNYTILVHGYASAAQRDQASNGVRNVKDFWYWKGRFSNGRSGSYDVVQDLKYAAQRDGAINYDVIAANWDGFNTVGGQTLHLTNILNTYCRGRNTCDIAGHSTGDAIIGHAIHFGQNQYSWNIRTVFVAGGAGGGTQAADYDVNGRYFASWIPAINRLIDPAAPVAKQLIPTVMMNLYDHNMGRRDGGGKYGDVPNVRFVGSGKGYDAVNGNYYLGASGILRGDSDGLVPFSSQGGVSVYDGDLVVQAHDAYCLERHTGIPYSCGQLNVGKGPASQWVGVNTFRDVPLFRGYEIGFLDRGEIFNHTDQVGYMGRWIRQYKGSSPFPVRIFAQRPNTSAPHKCLDVGLNPPNGRQAYLWECNYTDAQFFLNDGSGRLRLAANPNKCLDVNGAWNANGTAVQIWDCNSTYAQDFALGGHPVTIQWPAGISADLDVDTGKRQRCLDVHGGGYRSGDRIALWDCWYGFPQQWSMQ